MAKGRTLMDEVHQEVKGDRALDALYQRELARVQLANQIAKLRERSGLAQAQLTRRTGTQQAGVARMEWSTYRGYTAARLAKIAAAKSSRLEVKLIPSRRKVPA